MSILMRALPTKAKAVAAALATLVMLAGCATTSGRHSTAIALDAILAGPRPAADRSRDGNSHPVQTLLFFGLRPGTRVLQVWPRTGYYTRIIAPLVRWRGRFYAALIDPGHSAFLAARNRRYRHLLAAHPHRYGRVRVVTFPLNGDNAVAPGSVTLVLAFGDLHRWMACGVTHNALRTIYQALASGGVLGVVDNRADPAAPVDPKARNGYVNQSYAIKLIESAGFRLVATSEVNANPGDTRHHPAGAWTLPPAYRLGTFNHKRYAAIGEPDRFTLKFVKTRTR